MRTLKYPRVEIEGIPHTDDLNMFMPEDEEIVEAFSGHVPVTLEVLSNVFGSDSLVSDDRVFLWRAFHAVLEEVSANHGWTYLDQAFFREYDMEADPDTSQYFEYKDSANQVVDLIWGLKTLIQEN